MNTFSPHNAAWLLAYIAFFNTRSVVTNFEAFVTAWKRLRTFLTTRNVLDVTHDVAANHTAAVAFFTNQFNARWAGGLAVAHVPYWMSARMHAGALSVALWWFGAARDRREKHLLPTMTSQLIEANVVAGVTRTAVTALGAVVAAARQLLSTVLFALVNLIHTASVLAFMLPTLFLLVTATITRVVANLHKF